MAGEPILIIDDTPVNLKLTRILLANEGYKVQTAASAEEALELLGGYHPQLILADIQLPGMDGLEMTRLLKRDERTRDIIVVALTAFAMKGDEQKALEAGCDGYITKPINTRTLGSRIREYLDRRAEPPGGAPPVLAAGGRESVTASEMNALRRRFLTEGEEGARHLLRDLDGPFNAADAGRVVHHWVGTGALLGYNAIGRISREVEGFLAERPIDAAEVRQSLTNLVFTFTCLREAFDLPVPQEIVETLSGKRVALVGMPVAESQRLATALERASAKPVFYEFSSGPEALAPDLRAGDGCDLAVISVRPGTARTEWVVPSPGSTGNPPLVFAGRREDLIELDPAVQAQARGMLMDSWQPEEALVRLSLALSNHFSHPGPQGGAAAARGSRLQVLIAGGDATVLALAGTAFESFGMDYQTASDGAGALDAARRLQPEAMVLDAGIPGLDAYRVLSAIRSESLPVRILLLAGRHQESDILRGVTGGAGDFLFKPFSPMELVARLNLLTGH